MKINIIIFLGFCFLVYISCKKESTRTSDNNYTKPLDSCFYFILDIDGIHNEYIDTVSDYNNTAPFRSLRIIDGAIRVGVIGAADTSKHSSRNLIFKIKDEDSLKMEDIINAQGKRFYNNYNHKTFVGNGRQLLIEFYALYPKSPWFDNNSTGYVYSSCGSYSDIEYINAANPNDDYPNKYFEINKSTFIKKFYDITLGKELNLLIIEGTFNKSVYEYLWDSDCFGCNTPINKISTYYNGKFRIPILTY